MVRRFEPIDSAVLQSAGMAEMCNLFAENNELPEGAEIEIHQMRVVAIQKDTLVAPEGIHQDGFDHIAMIAIHRHNIVGGEIMLYDDSHHDPFFKKRWRTVKPCCWQTANCGTTPRRSTP